MQDDAGAGIDDADEAAAALLALARAMDAHGLNRGTAGNASLRHGAGFLLTPTGVPPSRMTLRDLVTMDMDGKWLCGHPARRPSSEWRFHRDLLSARPEVGAVVHAHPPAATALACLRRSIPAFHYMVAVAGGDDIRCAPYATFGTQALSDNVIAAMQDRRACLLANHGLIAVGTHAEAALGLALEVEGLAEVYLRALAVGEPVVLDHERMQEVHARFALGYGDQAADVAPPPTGPDPGGAV